MVSAKVWPPCRVYNMHLLLLLLCSSSVSRFSSVRFASALCVEDVLSCTHKFSHHAIIPVIDPSGSAEPFSPNRLLQTRPASGNQLAPWRLRHALIAVFTDGRRETMSVCIVICIITHHVSCISATLTVIFCVDTAKLWFLLKCVFFLRLVRLRVSCCVTRPGNK